MCFMRIQRERIVIAKTLKGKDQKLLWRALSEQVSSYYHQVDSAEYTPVGETKLTNIPDYSLRWLKLMAPKDNIIHKVGPL